MLRNHRDGHDVRREVEGQTADFQCQQDSEGHSEHHHHGVDRPFQTHSEIGIQHIIDKIDKRNSRYDEQCAGKKRMERSCSPCRKICGEPRYHCGNERRDGDGKIFVDAELVESGAAVESEESSERCVEERNPVAAELDAESAAGQCCTGGSHQLVVVAWPFGDFLQFLLVLFGGEMFAHSLVCEVADGFDGSEVDAVLDSFLEFRERVGFVAEVYHQDVMVNEDMEVFLIETEEKSCSYHVSADSVSVRCAFQQKLSGPEQQVQPFSQ